MLAARYESRQCNVNTMTWMMRRKANQSQRTLIWGAQKVLKTPNNIIARLFTSHVIRKPLINPLHFFLYLTEMGSRLLIFVESYVQYPVVVFLLLTAFAWNYVLPRQMMTIALAKERIIIIGPRCRVHFCFRTRQLCRFWEIRKCSCMQKTPETNTCCINT